MPKMNSTTTSAELGAVIAQLFDLPHRVDMLLAWGELTQKQREALTDVGNAMDRFMCSHCVSPSSVEIIGPDDFQPTGHSVFVSGSQIVKETGYDGARSIYYRLTGEQYSE